MQVTEKLILNKIKKARRGTLFFAGDFNSITNSKAINKALERMTNSNELYRVSTGIYVRPAKDKIIGIILPNIDDIAHAISRRDKARIIPTGSYALYKLGLTTQVPSNIVYLTDGAARRVKIGNQTIQFKKTSSKNLSAIGDISTLAIQALRSIGKNNVTKEEIETIKRIIKKEKPFHLRHDMKIAPVWIRKILNQ